MACLVTPRTNGDEVTTQMSHPCHSGVARARQRLGSWMQTLAPHSQGSRPLILPNVLSHILRRTDKVD